MRETLLNKMGYAHRFSNKNAQRVTCIMHKTRHTYLYFERPWEWLSFDGFKGDVS